MIFEVFSSSFACSLGIGGGAGFGEFRFSALGGGVGS